MPKKRSPETEEYLETLVRYKDMGKEPKVKELAKDLGVSSASVSEMLKKLSKKGLLKYERYGEIRLTRKGEELGRKVLRKHLLLERFLEFIGVRKNKIHDEACILEHALSDDVEKALRRTVVDRENVKRLTDMRTGERGTILFVSGGQRACKRLTDMGLTPGTRIEISRASSRAGPVELCIRSSCLAVGRGLAKKIFVEVVK
jgi:DtxR family Mn-dependent transcriptional regulator